MAVIVRLGNDFRRHIITWFRLFTDCLIIHDDYVSGIDIRMIKSSNNFLRLVKTDMVGFAPWSFVQHLIDKS